jgi:hypothetical protein
VAKQSGLGMNCYISGYQISNDTTALGTIRGGHAVIDVTGIDKSAYERIGGLRDGEISFTTAFNVAAGQEHPALSTLPTTDAHVMVTVGTAIGSEAACCVAKQVNYDPTRGQDGQLTFAVQALPNAFGLEWGNLLTAGVRTDTTTTNGTALDGTAATSFGWQAYCQVFSVTGTSVTVKLQDSADNSTFADVTGGGFAAVLAGARGQERIVSASGATLRRYVRAVTTGTFTNAQFAVSVVRNQVAQVVF